MNFQYPIFVSIFLKSSFFLSFLTSNFDDVLELVQENIPFSEIIEKYYPDLEIEDIKACVRYAKDLVCSEEIHFEAV